MSRHWYKSTMDLCAWGVPNAGIAIAADTAMKSSLHTTIARLLSTAALLVGTGVTVTPAQAAQCILNKGTYVMHVAWFRPTDVLANHQKTIELSLRNTAPAVLRQYLFFDTSSCTNTDEALLAVVSVAGCGGYTLAGDSRTRSCGANSKPWVDTHVMTASNLQPRGVVGKIRCHQSYRGYCAVTQMEITPKPPDSTFVLLLPPSTHSLEFFGGTSDVQWRLGESIQ
jgi:hypothetical protein